MFNSRIMPKGIMAGQIDVDEIVQKLMLGQQREMRKIQRQEQGQSIQITALGQLQNLMQSLQTSIQSLDTALGTSYSVTSSNSNIVAAQVVGNNLASNTHTIAVTKLAQAESNASTTVFSSNSASLNITDTLTFSIGSNQFSVGVASGDSLQNVCDNINNSSNNIGVTASIISAGTGQYQLVVSSDQTGLANQVNVSETGSDFNMTQVLTAAQDAQFTFDNLNIDRPTNTITDVVNGLSFTLLDQTPVGQPVNLIVTGSNPTPTNATASIQNVLNAYNQIMSYIDQVQVDPATRNNTFDFVKTNLQSIFNGTSGSGQFTSLADMGILLSSPSPQSTMITTTDRNGRPIQKQVDYVTTGELQINTTDANMPQLSNLLASNFSQIQSFLTNSQTGLLTNVNNSINPVTGNISQIVSQSVTTATENKDDLAQDVADEQARLQGVEDMYYKKYSALNVALQRYRDQSEFLTRQLQAFKEKDI